jgi:NADPH2:quinone reductase
MTHEKQFMKAIDLRGPGGPEQMVYGDMERPQPGPGQVLIRVRAAGVNRPDLLQRRGHYPPPPGASPVLGLEVAGIIEETGEAVCALLEGGGYAEYAVAARAQCLPLPKGLSFEEAAALPECVFTVWNNVFIRGGFQSGETVLVHGGASGIGTTAIQMIRAFGGHVLVTCGSAEKAQACLKLGANLAINYKTQDFVAETLDYTQGRGVDLVLDMVGGDYVPRNLSCLATDGRHVSIAFLNGKDARISVQEIMQKRLVLTGSTLRPRPAAEKAALAAGILEKVWPLVEKGEIRPLLHKTFALQDAAKAHAALESGDHTGKIVLKI